MAFRVEIRIVYENQEGAIVTESRITHEKSIEAIKEAHRLAGGDIDAALKILEKKMIEKALR